MKPDPVQWESIAPKKLSLVGTKIIIEYLDGLMPYHIHRLDACHGCTNVLAAAKTRAVEIVGELLELGVDL